VIRAFFMRRWVPEYRPAVDNPATVTPSTA
jgi:hypothetical protein